ncbi:MAG: peptide deformylase [Microgenomates group bacterium]
MKKIVNYPTKVLRIKTPEIVVVDQELLGDIDDLRKILSNERAHAAGLAAPQIDVAKRFFGLVVSNKRELKIFVNPKIVRTFGEKTRPVMVYDNGEKEDFLEGCLSFPNLFGSVKRYLKIETQWQEVVGTRQGVFVLVVKNKILEGIEAIAYQHELDHLDGILFIDHIKEEKGDIYSWEKDKKIKINIDEIVDLE